MKTEKIFYERLDKVFDALRIKNLKINDEQFSRYTNFSRTYLDKLEEFVNKLNELCYLWVQIDDDVVKVDIKKIYFDSTYQYYTYNEDNENHQGINDDYIDVYTIEYENNFTENITSIDLYYMLNYGAAKRKKGVIGIDRDNVINRIYSYPIETNV